MIGVAADIHNKHSQAEQAEYLTQIYSLPQLRTEQVGLLPQPERQVEIAGERIQRHHPQVADQGVAADVGGDAARPGGEAEGAEVDWVDSAEAALSRLVDYAPPWLSILAASRVRPDFNLPRLKDTRSLPIGGGRGFGPYMPGHLALLGSTDQTFLLEPEFGHIDHFMTPKHRDFVEKPIYDWAVRVFGKP